MYTIPIAPEKWQKLYGFLRAHPRVYAGNEENCRRFIVAVYWILRTGAQWRALPERFGKWNSVYRRFARWEDRGILAELHDYFVCDPDMTAVMLDSTVVRAHMCAVGGSKRGGSQKAQALGRSRGGFSSKIHIVVDAVGFPLRFSLTGGERHDITQAESLLWRLSILTLSSATKVMILTISETCSKRIRSKWSSLLVAIANNNGTMTSSVTKNAISSNASSTKSSGIGVFSLAMKN